MSIEIEYYLNGTPEIDPDSEDSQKYQGATLVTVSKVSGTSNYITALMRNGSPYFGYKARKLVDPKEIELIKARIEGVAKATNGYVDSEGTWFPGNAGPRSYLTAGAYAAKNIYTADTYILEKAEDEIDELADKISRKVNPPRPDYQLRYQEAVKFLADPNAKKTDFPYLSHMKVKGGTMADAAKLVVEKYNKAQEINLAVSELRMRKSEIKAAPTFKERKQLYNKLVADLKAVQATEI
jgi:hypothetical protein